MHSNVSKIRNINGVDVYVKYLGNGFWIFNDVFVSIADGYELTDEKILGFLDMKNDDMLPYLGANNGDIIVINKSQADGSFYAFNCTLDDITDEALVKEAKTAYDEYRVWAGI